MVFYLEQGSGHFATYKKSEAIARQNCSGGGSYHNIGDCTILLQRNGWKFPKDYPIKF